MATLAIRLDERHQQCGRSLIKFRISHNYSTTYINTGIYVAPTFFTGNIYSPLAAKCPMYKEYTVKLASIQHKAENAILELETADALQGMTAAEIRDYILKGDKKQNVSFVDFFATQTNQQKSAKSVQTYVYTQKKLEAFMALNNKNKKPTFKQIDYEFLKDFENWLTETGVGVSSRGIIFRNIRAVYNEGIRRKLANRSDYPFFEFSIKQSAPKEIITICELDMKKFLSLDLSALQGVKTLERARDIIMISIYLCGMNLRDIYELDKSNIQKGHIVFTRSKINHRNPKPTRIAITPELKVLIDKYAGKDHVFKFAEEPGMFETFQRNLSQRLERLSKMIDAKINMAIARHTWATYASKLGVEEFVISKSLGHMDNDVTSRHYIEYDWKRTDNANRMVIDYIWDGVERDSIPAPKLIRA